MSIAAISSTPAYSAAPSPATTAAPAAGPSSANSATAASTPATSSPTARTGPTAAPAAAASSAPAAPARAADGDYKTRNTQSAVAKDGDGDYRPRTSSAATHSSSRRAGRAILPQGRWLSRDGISTPYSFSTNLFGIDQGAEAVEFSEHAVDHHDVEAIGADNAGSFVVLHRATLYCSLGHRYRSG